MKLILNKNLPFKYKLGSHLLKDILCNLYNSLVVLLKPFLFNKFSSLITLRPLLSFSKLREILRVPKDIDPFPICAIETSL